MKWTEDQMKVIETRNRNLLVSAAAGSGKTAVLVERILRLISRKEDPVDVDRLLVMTFTKAAAAEMRERIALAIEKRLEEEPDNEHLQVQAALVSHAQITTIDSFCLSLIRDHFNLLDIDPSFRIGDEGELTLMRADVMEKLLEEYYGKDDEAFEKFVDTYASGKSDDGIEDYIMQVYRFAQSNPFPGSWIENCRDELKLAEAGDFMETGWAVYMMRDVEMQLREMAEQYEMIMEICRQPDGPEAYIPVLAEEYAMLGRLSGTKTYEELFDGLQTVGFGRLPAVRGKDTDPVKKEQVSECRNRIKKQIRDLCKTYGQVSPEEVIGDMLGTKDVILKLLELAEEFSARYQEAKKDRNLVDFNDLEHYALDILVKQENGQLQFTETAEEIGSQYEEILVDEYQDSNYVQEMLIQSLSGERFGRPNVFMVGDVKQSIYRFRLARPELFMEKYDSYTTKESLNQKIELRQNFRSREQVLDSVNALFYQIMTRKLGNVEYTRDTALYPGADFPESPDASAELLLIDTGKDAANASDEETADYTARELEAKMTAVRIRQLTDLETGFKIWDREKGEFRAAGYGDIVILLRSVAGWSEVFVQVLTREGIPAFAETGTGYFDTIEVETVLAMLAVIDNPMQDIPLAAVLKSPIAGLTDEELAWMMALGGHSAGPCQDRGIYKAFTKILNDSEEGAVPDGALALAGKLRRFADLLAELRKQAAYLPIHQLIYQVFCRTGYYDYASAMPAGEVRRANLDMLMEKAAVYEKTSYKGLFQFIRYINLLKKYDTDFGEASASNGRGGMVRIMSIHKSKGLEFPVVFLAGLGKQFNKQDVRGKLVIDLDLGIGTDYLNLQDRTRVSTLKKQVLKRKMDMDNLGEELRILYVAMTRAREKLIMTGTDRSLGKKLEKWQNNQPSDQSSGKIPCTILTTASSYLDWVLMARPWKDDLYQVKEVSMEELAGEEAVLQVRRLASREGLRSLRDNRVCDEKFRDEMERCFSYEYPYRADIALHTKMTVSELKNLSQKVDDYRGLIQAKEAEWQQKATEIQQRDEKEREETLPQNEKKEAMRRAARRGTAYHRILELLDFTDGRLRSDVERQMDGFLKERRITEETRNLVRPDVIWRLGSSSLGQRMKAAQEKGFLRREQQFVMGIPAREMGLADSDELVLIQGIIDGYFQEEDGLVIVDYKTDWIQQGDEERLAKRYRVQLDYYQKALEQITGCRVKERIIYSLALQKEIAV